MSEEWKSAGACESAVCRDAAGEAIRQLSVFMLTRSLAAMRPTLLYRSCIWSTRSSWSTYVFKDRSLCSGTALPLILAGTITMPLPLSML